jgi:hypothetical protein
MVLADRFWFHVRKGKNHECWEWTAATCRNGYGKFNGKTIAHRVAWELTNGHIPENICICHKCDNKLCCNTRHMFMGTQSDNMKDMYQKGRKKSLCGERHPWSKLKLKDVNKIRSIYAGERGQIVALAKEYGVGRQTIREVVHGKRWKIL